MPDFSPHCTPTGSKMAAENISQTIAQLLLIDKGLHWHSCAGATICPTLVGAVDGSIHRWPLSSEWTLPLRHRNHFSLMPREDHPAQFRFLVPPSTSGIAPGEVVSYDLVLDSVCNNSLICFWSCCGCLRMGTVGVK